MKKVLFYAAIVLMSLSFVACEGTDTLKDRIISIGNYDGTDSEGDTWQAIFTATTFTATSETAGISVTSSNWDVTENADGSGIISIQKASMVIKGETFEGEIVGTVDKSAKKIVLGAGDMSITLEKK